MFGCDGSGSYAAFMIQRPDAPLLDQPIVFFGSEGELGAVAAHFSDLLWLLGDGVGPKEAIEYSGGLGNRAKAPALAEFAATHATGPRKTAGDVIGAAKTLLPNFEASIRALCR